MKFIKEIGRFLGLKAAVILGGDSMEDQFSVIHGSPDILVATPGNNTKLQRSSYIDAI